MFRVALTLLIGLMLTLGGGATALTFKSDGTVVQNDGSAGNKIDEPKTGKKNISNLGDLIIESELPDCPQSFKRFLTGKTGQQDCFIDYTYPILTKHYGDRYIGEVRNGTWWGKGTYLFKNGGYYRGGWING